MSTFGSFAIAWDILLGPNYDLTIPSNLLLILGWITSGWVIGIHMGTPCQSFTRARDHGPGPPPLRSNEHPLGLPGLARAGDLRAVQIGNTLMRVSVRVLRACARARIPCSIENPRSSRIWLCPQIESVLRLRCCSSVIVDYCMFGKPWRKSTIFAGVHLDWSGLGKFRCLGAAPGLCRRTGFPHQQLSGVNDAGVFWTKIAEPYPTKLCYLVATAFVNFEVSETANRMWKLISAC